MRRLSRDPLKFDGFALFGTYGQQQSASLRDPETMRKFTDELRGAVDRGLESDTFVFGQRTQALFEQVVASLGACRVLKQEDAGELFHSFDEGIDVPDFRILLPGGDQLLVEVKNFHQGASAFREQRLKVGYLDGLKRYADAMKCDLRIATYWTQWNRWTLVPVSVFRPNGEYATLALTDATVANEMSRLGDHVIAARSPFRIRVVADPDRPRSIAPDGSVNFRILAREFYCAENRVVDANELRVAVFLLFYGDWEIKESRVDRDGDDLVAIEHEIGPESSEADNQGFEIIGALSSMISNLFRWVTTDDGEVSQVRAHFVPGEIGMLIPPDYGSDALPLWRFIVDRQSSQSPPRTPDSESGR